ncbi:hypothetical protein Golob_021545, partial [Gossypium lobatum]|nr:hypothetical protein [Gossypium lobatum]
RRSNFRDVHTHLTAKAPCVINNTCKRRYSYTCLVCSGGLNWIPHLSMLWGKDGDRAEVMVVDDWSAICEQLLGKVPNKFFDSQIEMKLLEEIFNYIDNSASAVEREQYTQAFILRWNNEVNHVGIVDELEDIWLLLDQRSEADFEFRQSIPTLSKDIEEHHKVDLWGRIDKD